MTHEPQVFDLGDVLAKLDVDGEGNPVVTLLSVSDNIEGLGPQQILIWGDSVEGLIKLSAALRNRLYGRHPALQGEIEIAPGQAPDKTALTIRRI